MCMVAVYSLCTVVNQDDAALAHVDAVADTASPPSQDVTDADVAVVTSEAEVVSPGEALTAVEQQPPQDSTTSPEPDCSTSAITAVALSSTASTIVPQELQDITPTSLLSPKSFYSKTVVHVADLSPLPSLSVTEKNTKRKSRTSKAADLTSTPYKKELESLPVNVRKATVRRNLSTGNSAECVENNKVRKMTDHGGQKKQKRMQHPKTAVAVGDSLPLQVGVNSQLGVGKWVLVKYHYQTGNREVYYVGQIKSHAECGEGSKQWDVHFLKRSHRSESGFVDSLPSDQQTDDVDDEDIVINLPDPVVRRGIFTFNYDFASYKVE